MTMQHISILAQQALPQHLLSRIMGKITTCRANWLKNFAIKAFIKAYHVDMSQALITDPAEYHDFNSFFIRQLRPDTRPIANQSDIITSPVDGTISQIGTIKHHKLIQAKGHDYKLETLLACRDSAHQFTNGQYATIYLAPKDYHRVHMPYTGTLTAMRYIPGKLFSVNQLTTQHVNNLFARNERVICEFATALGPMAVIFVGAFFVASISTHWHGTVAPQRSKTVRETDYTDVKHSYNKGDEIGYFNFGSTVIILFPQDSTSWKSDLQPGDTITMGSPIGNVT